jgi:uncharacterized protein (TIGR02466 family)
MIHDLFKIPIWVKDLKHDNYEIASYCLEYSKNHPSANRSNINGYQSPDLKDEHEKLNPLFNDILTNATEFARSLECSESLDFTNIWFNINSYKDFHRPHTHPQSVLSGVYYIEATHETGNIEFYPPGYELKHENWNKNFVKNTNKYTAHSFKIESVTGRLYIFPSWLLHSVEPNPLYKQRIALSFNLI